VVSTALQAYYQLNKNIEAMKRVYQDPALRTMRIEHPRIICVSDIGSNVGLKGGGGGHGSARARQQSVWDDEWDDWDM